MYKRQDYIRVEGNITSFQGSLQLNVRRLRKAREGEFAMEDYIPCSSKSIDGMFKEISNYVNHVPVSYTHLDVYKRQVSDILQEREVISIHDVREGGIFAALWEMAAAKNVGLSVDLKNIPIRQHTICLLYTSRCV